MAKIVFNPFTGNFDYVVTSLAEVDDVDPSVVPTKGSLLAGDGSLWQELGVGANSYVLVADSAQTLGIRWAPAPPGIGSFPGVFTVPIAVAVGDVVYSTGANSADVADDSTIARLPALGVVLEKPTPTTATVFYRGEVNVLSGLTPGATYFVGTLGAVTTTPPSAVGRYIQSVGVAIDSDTLFFDPGLIIGL